MNESASVFDDAVRLIDRRACLSVVRVNAELVLRDVDDGVRRSPVLAARSNVILLLRNQLVPLGAGSGVRGHVEDAFRVVERALLHVGNRVAEILALISILLLAVLEGFIEDVVVLALLPLHLVLIEGSMLLAIARELVRTCIRVIVALEDNVDLVGVVDRRELRAQQDAVGVRVIEAAAVDVLVHDDNAPLRIRVGLDGLLDQGLMVGCIVVVGIDDDEEGIAVRVVVAVACFRRIGFFRKRIRHIEVVLVTRRHAVMVADARGFWQAAHIFRLHKGGAP